MTSEARPVEARPVEVETEGEPERSGPTARLVAAAISLLVGVAALVASYQLGLGTLTAPDAGLWPALASAVIVVGSVVALVGARRADDVERFGRDVFTVGLGAASLGLFVLLFGGLRAWGWPGIGVESALAMLLVVWLKVIGRESWRVTVLITVGCTVALHVIFVELLGAPIPHIVGR